MESDRILQSSRVELRCWNGHSRFSSGQRSHCGPRDKNLKSAKSRDTQRHEYHVFPTFHKFFVDNFTGIVFARIDVDSLLDNSIGSAAERPSGSILFVSGLYSE